LAKQGPKEDELHVVEKVHFINVKKSKEFHEIHKSDIEEIEEVEK